MRGSEALEQAVIGLLTGRGRPHLGSREIIRKLGLLPGQARGIQALLRKLADKGVLESTGGRFRARPRDGFVEGVLVHGADGVVLLRDGDRLLRLGDVAGAAEGDWIRAQEFGPARQATAEFVERVRPERAQWIGVVRRGSRGWVLVPYRGREDASFPIASRNLHGAEEGEVVVVESLEAGKAKAPPGFRVVERIGRPGDSEADFRAVVWHRRLPTVFGAEAVAEARALADRISSAELDRRLDLRDRCFLTIDPESARDHDDALFVEGGGSGTRTLWVAIADVSHFVKPGSALDREAWSRGNSVYFPGRSIPMLPERISSDLCSLRPGVDRLVVAVEMEVASNGDISRARFHEAVIRSRKRLSYAEAACHLGDPEAGDGSVAGGNSATLDADVRGQLRALGEVVRRLARRRFEGLSLDFDLPQPEVILDGDGKAKDIRRAERGPAHRAVEEAMLAANRVVAQALLEARQPTIFRVHEKPDANELRGLSQFYRALGLAQQGRADLLDRAGIAKALRAAKGRPEEAVVHYSTLRAMKQARYAPNCEGHFALGFEAYLHFTSPIRRYADLLVHRGIRLMLAERGDAKDDAEWYERVAIRTSSRERAAVAAEREMIDLARCAVMRGRVGDRFAGAVTGVAQHGLYITLDAPFVEGMVSISRLPGFFDHDPDRHRLVARGSRFQYRVGDRVRVEVTSVNAQRGWVDLDLVSEKSPDPAVAARKKGKPVGKRPTRRRGRAPGNGRPRSRR